MWGKWGRGSGGCLFAMGFMCRIVRVGYVVPILVAVVRCIGGGVGVGLRTGVGCVGDGIRGRCG